MSRTAEVVRETKETQIRVRIDLDGTGASKISTGVGFFDRWTGERRISADDPLSVERGGPPPTRDIPGQSFSRPPPLPGSIVGLFPQPGGSA